MLLLDGTVIIFFSVTAGVTMIGVGSGTIGRPCCLLTCLNSISVGISAICDSGREHLHHTSSLRYNAGLSCMFNSHHYKPWVALSKNCRTDSNLSYWNATEQSHVCTTWHRHVDGQNFYLKLNIMTFTNRVPGLKHGLEMFDVVVVNIRSSHKCEPHSDRVLQRGRKSTMSFS